MEEELGRMCSSMRGNCKSRGQALTVCIVLQHFIQGTEHSWGAGANALQIPRDNYSEGLGESNCTWIFNGDEGGFGASNPHLMTTLVGPWKSGSCNLGKEGALWFNRA